MSERSEKKRAEKAAPLPKGFKLIEGKSELEKYPYDRPDLWHKIQYLPEQIKNMKFYEGKTNSQYEKALMENYEKLKSVIRTSDIKKLRGK